VKPDDKRQTCWCGHRYRDHAVDRTTDGPPTAGWKCLALVDDPNHTSLKICPCSKWEPRR
jgi:hypothetical protein